MAASGTVYANMTVHTIDDVLGELTAIIDDCWQQNSRLGYFPAIYRKVTIKIKEGVETWRFEDGERMEQFDVAFARRYIEAYHQYRRGEATTRSWLYTFDMAQEEHPLIVQHLLLGMNAHINLDLGIVAAEICRGADLLALEHDFFEVNCVLAGLLDEVQAGVDVFSPFFRWIDRLGGAGDEAICNFSIRKARHAAWDKAQELHRLDPVGIAQKIDDYDLSVSRLARIVCPPSWLANAVFQPIRDAEDRQPRAVIEVLR
jgi:hypothetical protein